MIEDSSIVVEAVFDGEVCVRAPLGDFFGTAPGINAFRTYPFHVEADGTMGCRFVMPYAKTGVIRFVNTGKARAMLRFFAETVRYDWDANSYHFKAQWTGEHARTRPMRDMTFLKTIGEGVFVGDNLHVSNPSPAWWGEGDEKIYFDGQTFPSSIGTGTEDYFGYAWGDPEFFAKPFHAQPHVTKPDSFGQDVYIGTNDIIRWRDAFIAVWGTVNRPAYWENQTTVIPPQFVNAGSNWP